MAVRQQTLASVRRVFASYPDKMMTINEIANHSQLSYTAVKRTLHEMGARYVPGVYPQRWTLKEIEGTLQYVAFKPIKPTGDIVRIREGKLTDTYVEVPADPTAVRKWNDIRERIAQVTAQIDIQPSSNIKELINTFADGARTFASMALGLMEVSQYPDWYGQIFNEDVDDELAP